MIRTVVVLIFTIVVVPIMAYYFGSPLTELQTTIVTRLGILAVSLALSCFVISELAKNYSQVDKLWSLAPILYCWLATHWGGWNERMILLSVLVTIWGLRLSYNFARRGGYSIKFWEGEEDYRWAILRSQPPLNSPWVFRIFNLLFICLYQMILILLFTLPIVLSVHYTSVGLIEIILAAVVLGFVIMETIADQQQYDYQTKKYELINNNKPLSDFFKKGFTHTGLWSKMRHPNYTAEQSIWVVFYLFTIPATGQIINWSIIGCMLLLVLFKKSSDFSEEISAKKYPDYANYQKNVGRFIPKLW